jgi:hypothetical protein
MSHLNATFSHVVVTFLTHDLVEIVGQGFYASPDTYMYSVCACTIAAFFTTFSNIFATYPSNSIFWPCMHRPTKYFNKIEWEKTIFGGKMDDSKQKRCVLSAFAAILTVIVERLKRRRNEKRKRVWTRPWITMREQHGAYNLPVEGITAGDKPSLQELPANGRKCI